MEICDFFSPARLWVPPYKPASLITSPSLTRLPLNLNPSSSSLPSSPATSQPAFPISCHTSAQPRPWWEPFSLPFPRLCPLLSPTEVLHPPKPSLKPPGAETPLLAWWVSAYSLPQRTLPAPAPAQAAAFQSLDVVFLTFSFCWASQGFFPSLFFPLFLSPVSFPPSLLAFVIFRFELKRAPSVLPGGGTGWCPPLIMPGASLHPPLGELWLHSSLTYQTMYAVGQTSFVYCTKSYQLMCMAIYKLLSPALQLVAVGNGEKLQKCKIALEFFKQNRLLQKISWSTWKSFL